jgi:diguanylate cyclase (GGDEF)-like protein
MRDTIAQSSSGEIALTVRSLDVPNWPRFAVKFLFTVSVVAVMAWIGLVTGRGAGHVPAVWWANAVLLAVVLLSPRHERWPLIAAGFCGNMVGHLAFHDPASQVVLLSLCDTGEATFAVLAVQWGMVSEPEPAARRRTHEERGVDLTNRGRLLRFVLFGVLLGPLIFACLAGVILHFLVGADMVTTLRWFPPSALGMAIVTPLLLGLARQETKELFAPQRILKTLMYLGLLAITTLGIFSRGQFPLLFLIFPPLMFLVVELGVGGGALGACVVAAIGSIYTVAGHGLLARGQASTLEQRILILQLFLATAVLSVDVVGLVLGDLKRSALVEEAARVSLSDALDTLEGVARVDATTRIANRRRLDEALEEEWQRAVRQQTRLSLLLLDVDHFKSYNDHYGHLAGDECLRRVAEIVGGALRRSGDLLARFGGEEFAIVLPNTDSAGANELAEQVRSALHTAAIAHAGVGEGILTVSIGSATAAPQREEPATILLAAADHALYQAKRGGRDRVESSGLSLVVSAATEAGWHPRVLEVGDEA